MSEEPNKLSKPIPVIKLVKGKCFRIPVNNDRLIFTPVSEGRGKGIVIKRGGGK